MTSTERLLICPECGAEMVLRETTKFKYKNGANRKFWGCSQWPKCNGVHGAHPNGEPLGKPADQETKQLRIKAHAGFDRLWKEEGFKRGQAYAWIAHRMGKEIHIGELGIEDCKKVICWVDEKLKELHK